MNLAPEAIDAIARELDAVRAGVVADLGQRDVDHIRAVIRSARISEAGGRALLSLGVDPVTFALGVGALATAKILENMEIGHNVMHGQYDWTGDPDLDSRSYEWDIVAPGDDWRHAHNYSHHMFTNILGKDHDVGYTVLRVNGQQPWRPSYLVQPITTLVLAVAFQWAVALHDLRIGEGGNLRERVRRLVDKAGWQLIKDYAFYPALALANAPRVFAGNFLANATRNLWAFAVIFCGHFPDGVRVFREDETENESRGRWYLRQLAGSANLEGGRLFHILTGHLSFQIEHHLFPDLPASRYPEIAPRVREICARYGLSYNTGGMWKQLRSVIGQIVRHALPGGKN